MKITLFISLGLTYIPTPCGKVGRWLRQPPSLGRTGVRLDRAGDRDVFVSLYGPDFDGLFDFVLRSVRDRGSAAVALSDSLHRAWELFCERGAPYDVRGWLFVIARDAVLRRPQRRAGGVQEREGLVYTALEAERLSDPSLAFDRELIELVWDTATALGREDYSLLDLHLRRDLSVDELAKQLEVPRDDVAWNLSRLCEWFDSTVRLTLLATRSRHNCRGSTQRNQGVTRQNRIASHKCPS